MDQISNQISGCQTSIQKFQSEFTYANQQERNVAEDVNEILSYFESLKNNQAQPNAVHELGVWIKELSIWLPALQQNTSPYDQAMAYSAQQVLDILHTPIGNPETNSLYSAAISGNDSMMQNLVDQFFGDSKEYGPSVRTMENRIETFTSQYPSPSTNS